jgi:hypothetical protein
MRILNGVAAVVLSVWSAGALAQGPVDISKLPAEIKSLKWQGIEFASVSDAERCRALLLMNDVLDEVSAQLTAEADLLSDYLDSQGLGPEYAGQAPADDPKALTFADGQKVAVAMLRGPMAQSSYATQMAGQDAGALKAYENMYTSTCTWKWGAMADNRLRVRSMSAFLEKKGKLADYRAWVPGEVARRAEEHKQEIAKRQSAAQAQQQDQRIQRQQKLLQQQEANLAQQEKATQQMQQALTAAQQSQAPAASPVVESADGGYPNYYYGGYGVAAAAWYRDAAYQGVARRNTDARIAGWHGGGFRGGRR